MTGEHLSVCRARGEMLGMRVQREDLRAMSPQHARAQSGLGGRRCPPRRGQRGQHDRLQRQQGEICNGCRGIGRRRAQQQQQQQQQSHGPSAVAAVPKCALASPVRRGPTDVAASSNEPSLLSEVTTVGGAVF